MPSIPVVRAVCSDLPFGELLSKIGSDLVAGWLKNTAGLFLVDSQSWTLLEPLAQRIWPSLCSDRSSSSLAERFALVSDLGCFCRHFCVRKDNFENIAPFRLIDSYALVARDGSRLKLSEAHWSSSARELLKHGRRPPAAVCVRALLCRLLATWSLEDICGDSEVLEAFAAVFRAGLIQDLSRSPRFRDTIQAAFPLQLKAHSKRLRSTTQRNRNNKKMWLRVFAILVGQRFFVYGRPYRVQAVQHDKVCVAPDHLLKPLYTRAGVTWMLQGVGPISASPHLIEVLAILEVLLPASLAAMVLAQLGYHP